MLDFQARAAKRISQTYRCQQAKYSTVAEMYLVCTTVHVFGEVYLVLHHCALVDDSPLPPVNSWLQQPVAEDDYLFII